MSFHHNTTRHNSNTSHHRNTLSYKRIKLTHHSQQRAEQRLSITSSQELKKRASLARRNGIRLENINPENLKLYSDKINFTYEQWIDFLHHFKTKGSTRFYYYKDYVWIFGGNGGNTLISVVPLNHWREFKSVK